MPFALVFLAVYETVAVLIISRDQHLNGVVIQTLGPRAGWAAVLVLGIAPLVGMFVGATGAAHSAQTDIASGSMNRARFFSSFWTGFAIAWYAIVIGGLRYILGPTRVEQVLTAIGAADFVALGCVLPAFALYLATKGQSAWARSAAPRRSARTSEKYQRN